MLDEDENKGCKLAYSLQARKWHLLTYVRSEQRREGRGGEGEEEKWVEEAGKNPLPHKRNV